MIKVSFNNDSYKRVERFNDKVTFVTLTGRVKLPENLCETVPKHFITWLYGHKNPKVQCFNPYEYFLTITAKGKAIRSDKDKDNPILAERIAESKAKLKIYKFIHSFISKYILEYSKLITGYDEPLMSNVKDTDDSLYGMADTYMGYITTEENHLADLIAQS